DRPPTCPVRDRAADEAEHQHRHVSAEADRPEERRSLRHVVDEPAERRLLDPDAEVRDERAGPEEAIVARAEHTEHATTSSRARTRGQTRRLVARGFRARRRDAPRAASRAP